MNIIRTTEIKLTEKEYFKLLTLKYFKQKWWLLGLMMFIGISALVKEDKEPYDYFMIILALSYQLYLIYYFWSFAYSKENKIIYLGRSYHFEENQVVAHLEDGTESQINLDHFIKTYKTKEYVMLYLSKATFLYLPKYALTNEDEFQRVIIKIESKIYANKYKKQ